MEEGSNPVCKSCRRILKNCACSICKVCKGRFKQLAKWDIDGGGTCATCPNHCQGCCGCNYCLSCGVFRDGMYEGYSLYGRSAFSRRAYTCCLDPNKGGDSCCQDHGWCRECSAHLLPGNVCSQCDDYCASCCTAHRQKPAWTFCKRPLTFYEAKNLLERRTNPSSRLIGVEIEVSGHSGRTSIDPVCEKWNASIVHDGSVMYEINTSPASGDKFLEQIKDLTDGLKAQQAIIQDNAGLHVHVDARTFVYPDIRHLILLYEKIEPGLLSMIPEERRKNSYCVPCGKNLAKHIHAVKEPKGYRDAVIKSIYGNKEYLVQNRRKKYFRSDVPGSAGRYAALNIHSFYFRGTIECRLHPGSVDYTEITSWGMLWAQIMDFVEGCSDSKIERLPENPTEALLAIAKNDPVKEYIYLKTKQYGAYVAPAEKKKAPTTMDFFDATRTNYVSVIANLAVAS